MRPDAELLVERHWDLVEIGIRTVCMRYRFGTRYRAEMESAAGLALWRAARAYDGRGNERGYLHQKIVWSILDELRTEMGRKGSLRSEQELRSLDRITHEGRKDMGDYHQMSPEERDALSVPDHAAQDILESDEALNGLLATLPNDRYREIVVRTVAGETEREIGERLGVTESRVNQMLRKIRERFENCPREETEWQRDPDPDGLSLVVNWT